MLAIKLQRIGKKHQPSYRVVVAERRSKLGGPPIENLGFYNPFTKGAEVKKDRVSYWLGVGARPSASVHNLFVRQGILSGPKMAIKIRKKGTQEAAQPAKAEEKASAVKTETVPPAGSKPEESVAA